LAAPAPVPTLLVDLDLNLPKWGTAEYWRLFQTDDAAADVLSTLPVTEVDVLKVKLNHEPVWADEPVVDMAPEHRRILEDAFMASLISDEDFDLISMADEDNRQAGRRAIDNGD
jgi:hypothetical protein